MQKVIMAIVMMCAAVGMGQTVTAIKPPLPEGISIVRCIVNSKGVAMNWSVNKCLDMFVRDGLAVRVPPKKANKKVVRKPVVLDHDYSDGRPCNFSVEECLKQLHEDSFLDQTNTWKGSTDAPRAINLSGKDGPLMDALKLDDYLAPTKDTIIMVSSATGRIDRLSDEEYARLQGTPMKDYEAEKRKVAEAHGVKLEPVLTHQGHNTCLTGAITNLDTGQFISHCDADDPADQWWISGQWLGINTGFMPQGVGR